MNLFGFSCLSRGLVSPCRRASRSCWWKSGVFNRERRLYCTSKTLSSVITSSQRLPSPVETEGSANLTPATAVEVKERDDSSWIKWSDQQWRGAGAPFLHVC